MNTKIPVFFKLETEIGLQEVCKKFQTSGLEKIEPYQALCLDKGKKIPCVAFYLKAKGHEDMLQKLKKILELNIGKIDFICIKSLTKAYFSLFIYEENMQNTVTDIENMAQDSKFQIYFMQKNQKETHVISILEPKYVSFLEYSQHQQEIKEWREFLQQIASQTSPALEGIMRLKYYKI